LSGSRVYGIILVACLLIAFFAGVIYSRGTCASHPEGEQVVATCFSPGRSCSSIVVSWIERANKSVHVLMFTFTLGNILDSLIVANGRGVEVLVVLERDQDANQPAYETLRAAGIEVRQDNNPAFMHNKFAVIDAEIVITGSFNWTRSADETNDENLVVIASRDVASAFEHDFVSVWQTST